MMITFLTDFGLADDFVGTCHGVMKRIAPDAQIIDMLAVASNMDPLAFRLQNINPDPNGAENGDRWMGVLQAAAQAANWQPRVSGSQLDGELVEVFVTMIESGRVAFHHADEADFERELAFEKRVADYAKPRVVAA